MSDSQVVGVQAEAGQPRRSQWDVGNQKIKEESRIKQHRGALLNRYNLRNKCERHLVMESLCGDLSCSKIQGDGEAVRMHMKIE